MYSHTTLSFIDKIFHFNFIRSERERKKRDKNSHTLDLFTKNRLYSSFHDIISSAHHDGSINFIRTNNNVIPFSIFLPSMRRYNTFAVCTRNFDLTVKRISLRLINRVKQNEERRKKENKFT